MMTLQVALCMSVLVEEDALANATLRLLCPESAALMVVHW